MFLVLGSSADQVPCLEFLSTEQSHQQLALMLCFACMETNVG